MTFAQSSSLTVGEDDCVGFGVIILHYFDAVLLKVDIGYDNLIGLECGCILQCAPRYGCIKMLLSLSHTTSMLNIRYGKEKRP